MCERKLSNVRLSSIWFTEEHTHNNPGPVQLLTANAHSWEYAPIVSPIADAAPTTDTVHIKALYELMDVRRNPERGIQILGVQQDPATSKWVAFYQGDNLQNERAVLALLTQRLSLNKINEITSSSSEYKPLDHAIPGILSVAGSRDNLTRSQMDELKEKITELANPFLGVTVMSPQTGFNLAGTSLNGMLPIALNEDPEAYWQGKCE